MILIGSHVFGTTPQTRLTSSVWSLGQACRQTVWGFEEGEWPARAVTEWYCELTDCLVTPHQRRCRQPGWPLSGLQRSPLVCVWPISSSASTQSTVESDCECMFSKDLTQYNSTQWAGEVLWVQTWLLVDLLRKSHFWPCWRVHGVVSCGIYDEKCSQHQDKGCFCDPPMTTTHILTSNSQIKRGENFSFWDHTYRNAATCRWTYTMRSSSSSSESMSSPNTSGTGAFKTGSCVWMVSLVLSYLADLDKVVTLQVQVRDREEEGLKKFTSVSLTSVSLLPLSVIFLWQMATTGKSFYTMPDMLVSLLPSKSKVSREPSWTL